MRSWRSLALIFLAAGLAASGCTTYDSAVPASTAVGAGAGALLGYGLTGKGTGAAAGAGAGALAGALTGVAIDESRRQAPPPPPPPQSYPPPPPPQPYAYQPDPTRGEFINNTAWRLEIFVDDDRYPVRLGAREKVRMDLDIGSHTVVARAYVETQFGERVVGTVRREINIDPRSSGWSLRFDPSMF